MWWARTRRTCVSSASRISMARSIGPRARSKGRAVSSASGLRDARKVASLEGDATRRLDNLDRLAVLVGVRRPQAFVARHDRVQGARQGRQIEPPLQADRERKVVVRLARIELIEEPEAL